jgi:uncharacterized membrane protein HdeD (DUF308 family)
MIEGKGVNMFTNPSLDNPFAAGINEIRSSWGWFLFFGIALIIFGAICIVGNVAATFATVLVLGWLLIASGVISLIHSFQLHSWNGFFLSFLSALLRGFTGYVLIQYPYGSAAGITLVVASLFVVGGLFRATGATMLKFPRWGWATFSGILSFVLGIMLLTSLPVSSIWFLGFAIGLDMISDGAALISLATAIHTLPKFGEIHPRAV